MIKEASSFSDICDCMSRICCDRFDTDEVRSVVDRRVVVVTTWWWEDWGMWKALTAVLVVLVSSTLTAVDAIFIVLF